MPNWAENDLVIRGKPATLRKFVRENKGVYPRYAGAEEMEKAMDAALPKALRIKMKTEAATPSLLCFHKSCPVPKSILKRTYDRAGYDWQTSNWGTKWGASEPEVVEDYAAGFVRYTFRTAWSPPEGWLRAAAKKYPSLNFRLEYSEEGMEFSGALELEGKKVLHDIYHE